MIVVARVRYQTHELPRSARPSLERGNWWERFPEVAPTFFKLVKQAARRLAYWFKSSRFLLCHGRNVNHEQEGLKCPANAMKTPTK